MTSKTQDYKQEAELLKEKLIKAKTEINQLSIYKRKAARMEEVDTVNIDHKKAISLLEQEISEK